MIRQPIYCDYNAGALLRPEAREAMARVLDAGGNASSIHAMGRRAKALMEDAREQIAACVDARAENIVFTSGATEALHLALDCAGAAALIVSAVEHDALYEQALRKGATIAPVDANGVIDLAKLAALLEAAAKPALVCMQFANNETGILQPLKEVAALVRQHGGLLLVDAAQARGAASLQPLDATYLVLSSHKLGGPPGAGALVLAPGAPFVTTRFGGGQERGRRPGTENAPAIAGFGAALNVSKENLAEESARVAALRDRFEAGLPNDAIVFVGSPVSSRQSQAPAGKMPAVQRLPNTSNFALPGLASATAVMAMDLEGVCVSSGAACSSGKVKSSRVLAAMGVAPEIARSALRVSFGWASQESDVDAALAALAKIAARRRVAEGALT